MQYKDQINQAQEAYHQEGPYTGVRRDRQTPSPRTELAEYRFKVCGPLFPGTDRDLFFNSASRAAYFTFERAHPPGRRVVHQSEEECLRETYSDDERANGLALLVCVKSPEGHRGTGGTEAD